MPCSASLSVRAPRASLSGMSLLRAWLGVAVADLYRLCRATVLILADHGVIHPGPTIYDSFWVRDSSIEGVAAALAGDSGLAETQFGQHYPTVFNQGPDRIDAVSLGHPHQHRPAADADPSRRSAVPRMLRSQGPPKSLT
jgi:hypothetical protein